MNRLSRITVALCLAALLAAPLVAGAAGEFVPIAGIPNLTEGASATGGLAQFLNQLYFYLIGLAVVLAVIEIIIGGFEISTQDSVSKQSAGRKRITQAIFGLVLILSPYLVFSLINPSILNLSLNLPPLDTQVNTDSGSQNVPLTQTQQQICSGYSQFQIVPVPQNKFCSDVLGAGWANVDAQCAGVASTPAGYAACGLNNSYQPPASAQGNQPVQSFYPTAQQQQIPAGSWCYQIAAGFVCSSDQNSCATLAADETDTIMSSCASH